MAGLTMALFGAIASAAPPSLPPRPVGPPVRLAVEVSWKGPSGVSPPGAEEGGLDLELTEGRVLEALAWPLEVRGGPRARPRGWRLGAEPSGKVRVRIEAPVTATLVFRGWGKVVRVPVLGVLEGPQRSLAQSPLEVGVERLAWDAIPVDLERGDGTVAPGGTVAVSVGFNVLTPEPTEVSLRCSAELRPVGGGEPIWRQDQHEVVATDVLDPPAKVWNIPAPRAEGTYVLEFRASWEPLAGLEGTRLGRWVRRRWNATTASAVRRTALTVVSPRPPADEAAGGDGEWLVETIDLARLRGQRPTASGRALAAPSGMGWAVPEEALVEATRRDRLRGWITHAGSETAVLAPADANGLAWSALGLKVPRPGRPHRLSLSVVGGHPSSLGVALVDSGGAGGRPRLLLDACASGPPILDGGPAANFSWLVWPDAADPVIVLVNRDPAATVMLGSVSLTELADVPPPPAIVEPRSEARSLGLYLPRPCEFDRFGGGATAPGDALALAGNLARYLAHCGASSVVLPEGLADRARRRALGGQAGEDPIGPDRLDLLLRVLGRRGYSAWLELGLDGPLPGLPDPGSAEALERGLIRVDRRGQPDGAAYHPLHPEVREALKRRVAEAAGIRKARGSLAGVLIRLGPGPTLLGAPDTGLDDVTFARFVREAFGPETSASIPGVGAKDPKRFAARSRFLAGPGRMPWLAWRSRGIAALYSDLAEAARRAAPGAALAVATPGLDEGPAGNEARRVDLAGLAPSLAWRAVGLDLEAWPSGEGAPIVWRGVGLSGDGLAQDLATSPELDAQVEARPGRGVLIGLDEAARISAHARPSRVRSPGPHPRPPGDCGLRLTAPPLADGTAGDELLGHSLAALDARWVWLAAPAVAGHEERVRRFARAFRALPAPETRGPADRLPFGVAVRAHHAGPSSYLALANDTPYGIRLEAVVAADGSAPIDDLGRGLRLAPEAVAGGGRRVVLDLLPFGVAALRVGAPSARVASVTPYPSEAVLAGMRAQFDELSTKLSRLNQASGGLGPSNTGFEPAASPLVQLTVNRGPAAPAGWELVGGGMGGTMEVDPSRPRSGRGSLRLHAPKAPAAVVSEGFPAKSRSALTVQAWLRSAEPDAKVRLWIEGEGAGQPYRRWSDLVVQPEWSASAVRASEFPPGGLDRVRLRFELLTAGTLWVDEVAVSDAAMSEAERLNARRDLMAALHAYREKRYADFARLAGSHWARTPGVSAAEGGAETSEAERTEMIRTGKATALPPGRLLR